MSRMATYGSTPYLTGVDLQGWLSCLEKQSSLPAGDPEDCRMCRKRLYLTNCKCKIIKLNVEACQKSYFCSILAALTCLHLSGLQTNRTLKGIKTLHLYHCTGFYSHLACHTLLCPDIWSILQKLILGDACKSVFYSIWKGLRGEWVNSDNLWMVGLWYILMFFFGLSVVLTFCKYVWVTFVT